ncbi:porin family protein [Oricola sp.]|uniref:outer membrane protein n=1 Tax=Oricola sp. TaxID=1979950 RepID=UPI0025DE7248|nr:porin family protein [Oricola sp.]MCI5077615.1 porin family protein [Oricola sp.]
MKTTLLLAATLATAMLSGAANAADTTYYDPAPQPAYTPQPQMSATTDWSGLYAGAQLGGGTVDVDGVGDDTAIVGGVHAGYLFQRGSFVVGPEVDIDMTGWDVGGTDVDAVAHAKLRAGVAADRLLVTGSVGYGHMWADGESDGGLTAGAGVDYAITDHVTGGADYLYTDIETSGPDVTSHTIRTRLGYKFN